MFSLGWMEISIILIVCVILVGPKELPAVIKTIKSVLLNLKGHLENQLKLLKKSQIFLKLKILKKKYLISLTQKREKSWMILLIKIIKTS